MLKSGRRQGISLLSPCLTEDQLEGWIRLYTGLRIPRVAVCKGHSSPFEYIRRAYFEPTRDLVVWAPRGGGKTRLAAVATLLDLLHKPGCAVRILGGSLEQSLRMWEHLLPDVERLGEELVVGKVKGRRIALCNGSSAGVLTQSQRAVRGLRVQKLRCDEVEMFDEGVWEAGQLVTKSVGTVQSKTAARCDCAHRGLKCHRRSGGLVSGAVEAISTFHSPWGLMSRIIDGAPARDVPVVRWCILEVLERCPQERECGSCPLWEECGGIAKVKCDGFVSIDDAIAMKRRVSRETWEAEMLCLRPSVKGSVFPSFDASVHVREDVEGIGGVSAIRANPHPNPLPEYDSTKLIAGRARGQEGGGLQIASAGSEVSIALDFGFAAPFVCLWVRTFEGGVSHVIDEYVQPGVTMGEHIEVIRSRGHGPVVKVACDPAGAGRNDQTAMSNVALLRQSGFTVRFRKSLIVEGVEMIRAGMRSGSGEAKLFVHPRCKRLIKAMRGYHYPEGGGETPVKDGENDHLVDALRYYFVNRRGGEVGAARRY